MSLMNLLPIAFFTNSSFEMSPSPSTSIDALKKDELLFQTKNDRKSQFHWTQVCIQNRLVVEVDFDVDAYDDVDIYDDFDFNNKRLC